MLVRLIAGLAGARPCAETAPEEPIRRFVAALRTLEEAAGPRAGGPRLGALDLGARPARSEPR